PRRVVRRTRQQDRRAARALRHEDHRVQLHAVAHRDHHVAPRVVVLVGRPREMLRRFARKLRLLPRDAEDRKKRYGCNREKRPHVVASFGCATKLRIKFLIAPFTAWAASPRAAPGTCPSCPCTTS